MKIVNILLFLLIINFALGQKVDYMKEIRNWTQKDFIENEISKITAYRYNLDTNGNIKDSIFLHRYQLDIQKNKIFGRVYGSDFEKYYNDSGQIIKDKRIRVSDWDTSLYEIDYEYDNLNREIKKTDKSLCLFLCNEI